MSADNSCGSSGWLPAEAVPPAIAVPTVKKLRARRARRAFAAHHEKGF